MSTITFTPRSEEDCRQPHLPPGDYEFEITSAEPEVSKSGNDMIHLKLKIWDERGEVYIQDDYLIPGHSHRAVYGKVREFARCVGALDDYENGCLSIPGLVGKCGRVRMKMGKERDGYPAKPEVARYLEQDQKTQRPPSARPQVQPTGAHSDNLNFSQPNNADDFPFG